MEAYGIPLVPWRYARNEDEVLSAAEEIGFPVALKTASEKIVHKSDVGAVRLNIKKTSELMEAYKNLCSFGEGVVVQKMVEEFAVEWIIGGRKDPDFEAVIITGLGGVYVGALKDFSIRIAPVGPEEAFKMISETKGKKLLDGFRGHPRLNIDALADAISRLSWLLHDCSNIMEIDLNPVLIGKDEINVVDWRMSLCGNSHSAQNR